MAKYFAHRYLIMGKKAADNIVISVRFSFRIQNLSLRHNSISDKGAESLGKALGNALKQNTKLLSLNLTGNRITDKGAAHIAGVSLWQFYRYLPF